jgi:hypothetical protein
LPKSVRSAIVASNRRHLANVGQKHVGCCGSSDFSFFFGAAAAQSPSPPVADKQFDGTYAFVSATKVNDTYFARATNFLRQCGDYEGGPLTIANGQALYGRLGRFHGTVGPQGELVMRRDPEPIGRAAGAFPGVEISIYARIDDNGVVRARRTDENCNYDLIWQKEAK